MKFLSVLLLACLAVYGSANLQEPECGATIRNLWLDVVVVIDNSKGMTKDSLTTIFAGLTSVFGAGTRLGTDLHQPKTTRLGLITYSNTSQIVAGLNDIQSLTDLNRLVFSDALSSSTSVSSYLVNGLTAAQSMLTKDKREGYKQVVVLYTNSYKDFGHLDPVPIANGMKSAGIRIITVGYAGHGDGTWLEKLERISSPGFNFTNSGPIVRPVQEALMQANCHCPSEWTQFIDPSNNRAYKSCIRFGASTAYWNSAQMACRNLNLTTKGYLVNEYSRAKQEFVLNYLKDRSDSYFNGLHRIGNHWEWDQPVSGSKPLWGYESWDTSYPDSDPDMSAVIDIEKNGEIRWQNVSPYKERYFVCETSGLDTDSDI